MSSHHIIREKQEPALYIQHFGEFDEEYLGQLLEWSPTLIVRDQEYEKAISLDLKVDLVAGDTQPLSLQEDTGFIHTEGNAIQAVLAYLVKANYAAVNIIDTNFNPLDVAAYLTQINIVGFTEHMKSYAISSGFRVWKPKDHLFVFNAPAEMNVSNLGQRDDGTFEVTEDGFVEFTFPEPERLMISEAF